MGLNTRRDCFDFNELATKVSIDLKNGRVTTGRTAQLLTNECNKLLSDCIALPAYIKYEHEDRNLSKKITSLYWVTPEHLNLNVDLLDDSACNYIAEGLDHFVKLPTSRNPLIMLRHLLNCVTSAHNACNSSIQNEISADDMLSMIIYIVLKGNTEPPSLYSNLKFIGKFLRLNNDISKSDFKNITSNTLYGSSFEYAFTKFLIAVQYIKNVQGNEDSNTLTDPQEYEPYIQDEYFSEINEDFKRKIDSIFETLQRRVSALIHQRGLIKENHEADMLLVADKLDKHNTNLHISKAVGSGFGIAGGIISIVGFGLMFTTLGVSAILIPVGAAIGGAGGLTAGGAGFVEYGIKKSSAKKIKAMREEYENRLVEVFDSLREMEDVLKSRLDKAQAGFNSIRPVMNTVDVIMKLVRISVATTDGAVDGLTTAFKLAGSASRGLAIAGVVFSAIILPVDMAYFGISLKALSNREKSEQAENIRQWLKQVPVSDEKISEALDKLKDAIITHGCNARAHIKDKKDLDFVKSEKVLEQSFKDIMEIVNKD